MDEQTLRVLEFDKILRMAGSFARTTPGRTKVQKMRPQSDPAGIQAKINLISEWKRLLEEGWQAGIDHFDDLSPLFKKLRPADAVLEPTELRSFLPLFDSALRLRQLDSASSCPGLARMISGIITHHDLRKRINAAIDVDGAIRDEASSQLTFIRRSIKSHEEKIRRSLESLLNRKDLIPHLQDFYITKRGNRWVVPVKRDSRGRVPGIVHDISNTGETVFVEPYAIHKSGNELEALRAEEKLEMYRVLQGLSAQLREHIHDIEGDYYIIADLDALCSLAKFSLEMHMSPPVISEDGTLRIIRGRHPLLWKTLRNEGRESDLVPLNVELGNSATCLVITGSNAGGKTVALKTAGVLSLMALCGFHVPADSGSSFPVLDHVFSDIGDEQSIEQKLSTFSAHISRLSRIISRSDDRTIVIIDELGTGTDPEQGGALACAILRQLKKQEALVIVSTHLGMLKAFAHTEPGVMNCAMEMEEVQVPVNGAATFRPTYRLIMGEPGMSHAFEIASAIGLQRDVIDEAKKLLKGSAEGLEGMISDLREQRRHLEESRREAEQLKEEVSRLRQRLDDEMTLIGAKKRDILGRVLGEAEEIMRKTKGEALDIIRALRRSSREEAGKVVKQVDGAMKELKKQKQRISPPKIIPLTNVTEGQHVHVQGLDTDAVVTSVHMKSGRCRVLVRGKEIEVSLSALSMPQGSTPDAAGNAGMPDSTGRSGRIDRDVPDSLNIVGQRVDPALALVERYLNDASLSDKREVRIIHGVGTGILMNAVREYLSGHPLVEGTRKGNQNEGGDGVTVVQL